MSLNEEQRGACASKPLADQRILDPYGAKKWIALAGIFLCHVALECAVGVTGGVGARLVSDYGINPADVGVLASASFLTGAVFAIPFGVLGDKIQVSTAMKIGALISLAGVWMRVAFYPTGQFWLYYLATFVIGFGLAGLNANSLKYLSLWFKNRIALAMGFYVAGAPVGITLGVQFPALFESTMAVLTATSVVSTVGVLCIMLLGKTPQKAAESAGSHIGISEYLAVFKRPWVWIASLVIALPMGAGTTFASSLTAAVVASKGVTEIFANNMVTLNSFGMMAVSILFPFVLEKIGMKRTQACILSGCLCIFLICVFGWFIPNGELVVLLLGITGFFNGVVNPLGKALLGMLKEIIREPEIMGVAGGLQATLQNLGAWLIPVLIALGAGSNNYALFAITGIVYLAAGIIAFAIPRRLISFDKQ